jgi:nicotinamide-nucleotide amidase
VRAYAEACKSDTLGIPPDLIEAHSAVSVEVATAMAEGALVKCASATIAVAVTCVGGPKPDGNGNPVGLTYLAVKPRGGNARTRRLVIEEHSSGRIRGEVLSQALRLLLDSLATEA